jgi:hypothetical protein
MRVSWELFEEKLKHPGQLVTDVHPCVVTFDDWRLVW